MNSYEPNMDRPLTPNSQIRRIGLISPCGWGNLGNAAIMSAMIANIPKRISGAEILGITLNPEDTSRRHGIPAFPLSGISVTGSFVPRPDRSKTCPGQDGNLNRLKHRLKKFPLLFNFLRTIRYSRFMKEVAHIMGAALVVRKLDRVIICGGGALDEFWGGPWAQPWALLKWSLLSRVYGVPLLFVSVGKSPLERSLSRLFVRIALRLAEYRSYRDQDSKRAVQTLLDTRHDPVYPDLAFSYPCPTNGASDDCSPRDDRLVIGVSPIAYCDPRVWPLKDEGRYAAYLKRMAEMVRWLVGEGYKVFFFATDSPDFRTIEDIHAMLAGSRVAGSAIEILPSRTEKCADDLDDLLGGICRADLIIASRLHGVILAHLNAIPVLALSFDPKVDSHMKAIGQMDYCLNIDHLMPDMLISQFRALKAFRQREQAHLRSATFRFRHLLGLQYDRIFGPPQSPDKQDRFCSGLL